MTEAKPEPPSTLIVYMAVLFGAWLLFWLAAPEQPSTTPWWVPFANQLPGFVIALLLAEGLYRRSRFAWTTGLVLGAVSIGLGLLNKGSGGEWGGVFTGGQILIGGIEIALLLLPPTQRWLRYADGEPEGPVPARERGDIDAGLP